MLANLTTDEKDAIKILDYWFIMEFLNQQSLKKYKEKETSALTYKKQLLEGRKKRPNKKVEDFVWFKPGGYASDFGESGIRGHAASGME